MTRPAAAIQRDRWLLSYADFITVLFAMFVLMYVSARAREQHIAPPAPVKPHPVAKPVRPDLLADLSNRLTLEQRSGQVMVFREPRGVAISLDDRMCFEPGESDLLPEAAPMFAKVADALAAYPNHILLEGHTDSKPIHNSRFRSNWELSSARSISVMQLMEQHAGMPATRFSIAGSADNAPVSSNETPEGRAHNRRVEIVVLDAEGS